MTEAEQHPGYQFAVDQRPGYLLVTIKGHLNARTEQQSDADIVNACTEHGVYCVLADTRDFVGELSGAEIFDSGSTLNKRGMGVVERMALLDHPQFAEQNTFYETVALNRGFAVKVFS